jgi:ABC-type sugar transport system substrate-binding protein
MAAATVALLGGAAVASGASRLPQKRFTVGFAAGKSGNEEAIVRGASRAARRLGVRFVTAINPSNGGDLTPQYQRLIGQHVDAIFAEGYNPAETPILNDVRAAGIKLLSAGDDIAAKRSVWVSQSDPIAYAEALADALATQLHNKGDYAILGESDQYPVADRSERIIERYVARAYPQMKLEGVVTGTGAGDPAELASVVDYIRSHPNLRGLVAVTPTEASMAAEGIGKANVIGKVFSSGNGGSDFGSPLPGFVRSGEAQLVFGGDPTKVGYLTMWAAHYLLTGHSFKPGLYHVGGPIGNVYYHAARQELRLGQPLTITKANVDAYVNTF